jgi:hypothetical protein
LDLLGEFASRRKDDDDRAVSALQGRLVLDVDECRQKILRKKNESYISVLNRFITSRVFCLRSIFFLSEISLIISF